MLIHNAIHKNGSLLVGIKNSLGMSTGGGVERLSETLTPILNPWREPEIAALRNEHYCAGANQQAAVVGEFGTVGLQGRDAQQIDIIAVCEEVVVWSDVNNTIRWGLDARPAGAVNVTVDRLDDRVRQPTANTKFVVFTDTNAVSAVTQPLGLRRVLANTEAVVRGPWILVGGGQALLFEASAANTLVCVSYRWRERQMLNTEELRRL